MKEKKKIYIPPAIERVRDCDELLASLGTSSEYDGEDGGSRQSKGSSFSFEEKEPDYGW